MGVLFEFIRIDCGNIKYLIVKKNNSFCIFYYSYGVKPVHFATVPSLKMSVNIIRYHLSGKYKAVFKVRELIDKMSKIECEVFYLEFLLEKK